MSEIFISYASADRQRIQPIINLLEKKGWRVWWDRKIPLGRTFDDVIEEAINRSECMIVIWSKQSVYSKWVRTEAGEGDRRGILVPIQIDDAIIPLAFRRIEAAQLADWDGVSEHPELENLFEAVSRHIKPSIPSADSVQPSEIPIEKREQLSTTVITPISDKISSNILEAQVEKNDRAHRAIQKSVSRKPETESTISKNADSGFDKSSLIRTLWKPILLISIVLSVISIGTSQLNPSPTLSFPIARFLNGICIGFLLSLIFPKLQWKYIFFYSALLAIGGFISALPFSMSNLSSASSSIISQIISLLIGAIIFGLFLRRAEPGIEPSQLVTSVLSWLVIGFIGGLLNSLIFSAIYIQNRNLVLANLVTAFISGVIEGVAIVLILFMMKRKAIEMV